MKTRTIIHKEIVQGQLFLYVNGVLIYKRWLKSNKGRMFHENEGSIAKLRGQEI